MSINHLIDAGATPKYDIFVNDANVEGNMVVSGDLETKSNIECVDLLCQNVDASFEVKGDTLIASGIIQSFSDRCQLDASARYTLSDITPVGYATTPTDLTLCVDEKKVLDYTSSTYKRVKTIKGNFKLVAGLPPAAVLCGYSMTITDPSLTATWVNSPVLYSQGVGVGANGAGAASVYLDVSAIDTSVQGQIKLRFDNLTHTQTPQGFTINTDFEVRLLEA